MEARFVLGTGRSAVNENSINCCCFLMNILKYQLTSIVAFVTNMIGNSFRPFRVYVTSVYLDGGCIK